jgi:hypothetical protein
LATPKEQWKSGLPMFGDIVPKKREAQALAAKF